MCIFGEPKKDPIKKRSERGAKEKEGKKEKREYKTRKQKVFFALLFTALQVLMVIFK